MWLWLLGSIDRFKRRGSWAQKFLTWWVQGNRCPRMTRRLGRDVRPRKRSVPWGSVRWGIVDRVASWSLSIGRVGGGRVGHGFQLVLRGHRVGWSGRFTKEVDKSSIKLAPWSQLLIYFLSGAVEGSEWGEIQGPPHFPVGMVA
jgi:hypothetical protein